MANGKTEFSPVRRFFIAIHALPMKKTLLITSCVAASLFLLQACGGDDDDTNPSDPVPPVTNPDDKDPGEPPGAVSAPFVRSNASHYILMSADPYTARYAIFHEGHVFDELSSSEQTPSGAMIKLNDFLLTGADRSVLDINGDANFAMGRWVKGAALDDGYNLGLGEPLTGTDGRAFHYLVYQSASEFPVSTHCKVGYECTSMVSPPHRCTGDTFTKPTYIGGGSKPALTGSSVTGEARIMFSGSSGDVRNGSLTVKANDEIVHLSFPDRLSSTTEMAYAGLPFAHGGSGMGVQLADAGNGEIALSIVYAAITGSGARYIGVGRMNCFQGYWDDYLDGMHSE
jgi:hypothetical protein